MAIKNKKGIKTKTICSERLVILGHIGAGGKFGMATNPINEFQQRLRNKWDKDKKSFGIPDDYPTDLIILGEPTEGINEKEKGEDISIISLTDQIREATSLICEWVGEETKNIYIVYTHSYHGRRSKESRIEDDVAISIRNYLLENNLKARVLTAPLFDIPYYGKVLRFRHGTRQGKNRASLIESTIKDSLIREALGDTKGFHVAFESHSHRCSCVGYENRYAYWVPCYKLLDTHGQFLNPDEWIPAIGCTFVSFEKIFDDVKVVVDMLIDKIQFNIETFEKIRKQRVEDEKRENPFVYETKPNIHISKRRS